MTHLTEFHYIIIFLASPEILAVIGLLVPPARRWLLKMVEDSDGDPHHTDGFFIAVLWCGTLCIRAAVGLAIYDVLHTSSNLGYVALFLSYGSILLGVRAFKNKLNLDVFTKKDKA